MSDSPIIVPSGQKKTNVVVPSGRELDAVSVPSGTRGLRGPRGEPGIILVRHEDDPTVPRPDTDQIVLWRGSVQPENWDTSQDLWLLE